MTVGMVVLSVLALVSVVAGLVAVFSDPEG
jgi:hypothetical protein